MLGLMTRKKIPIKAAPKKYLTSQLLSQPCTLFHQSMGIYQVYIFSSMRGQALAGLSDADVDTDVDADVDGSSASDSAGLDGGSKIICTHFDAELMCIKDTYTTVDSMEKVRLEKSNGAMVSTNEDGLSVVPF